jgi:hypothetical protein
MIGPGERVTELLGEAPVFVVVITTLAGTIEDVVGPFWDRHSAEAWARRNPEREGYRAFVRRVYERGVWTPERDDSESV